MPRASRSPGYIATPLLLDRRISKDSTASSSAHDPGGATSLYHRGSTGSSTTATTTTATTISPINVFAGLHHVHPHPSAPGAGTGTGTVNGHHGHHPYAFLDMKTVGGVSAGGPSTAGSKAAGAGGSKQAVVEVLSKRQPPSCDACRTRKLKCSGRPDRIELDADATAIVPCDHCREWSLDCSYLYQRKRRGRKNLVVERLAEEQKQRKMGVNIGRGDSSDDDDGVTSRDRSNEHPLISRRHTITVDPRETAMPQVPANIFSFPSPSAYFNPSPNNRQPGTSPKNMFMPQPQAPPPTMHFGQTKSEWMPAVPQAPQPNHAAPPVAHMPIPPPHPLFTPQIPQPPTAVPSVPIAPSTSLSGIGLATGSSAANDPSPNTVFSESSFGGPSSTPGWAVPGSSTGPGTASGDVLDGQKLTLESVLPRDLAMHVIRIYFEHVHCIIPLLHRPTFMAELAVREEEKKPIFFALIMATISMTLIHVPKSFFPIPAESVRRLSDHCLKYSYSVARRATESPDIDLVCLKYFQYVIHNKHQQPGMEAAAFGELLYLALGMAYHREESYRALNPVEAERRRRAFWTIYNCDKYEALGGLQPVMLRSDEFMGQAESVALPAELDDKCITDNSYMPSSSAVTLMSGFNVMVRLASVLGDILVHERDMRRKAPQDPEDMLVALKDVRRLQSRLKTIADKLPRPFQLDVDVGSVMPEPGWEAAIRDELDLFFSDPMSSETAKDGFLVLKANIHVTLAMIRLRLILHREDLLNRSGAVGTTSRHAAELVASDLGENVDWRHLVYQDLFKAVHCIPIQALAANGPSLVAKIRTVAVTLLDALPAQDHEDANVQGIAEYLLDFLNIMTSIESQFAD